ncbi:MAG: ferrous iron transport protein A [Clostridium sp.]|nr:ferrous iron transport protein A [Clostridium sp.]
MILSQMKENETGYITCINSDPGFERRFFDMGFITGQSIRCMNIGLFGSPIAYQIRGSKIALRKSDADKIGVIM